MKRIFQGIRAVWPPLALAATAFGMISMPGHFDGGLIEDLALGAAGIVLMGDAGARYAEYRRALQRISLASHNDAMLSETLFLLATFHRNSWCRRTALGWASHDAIGPNGRQIVSFYYEALGYKWWHLTPDDTFTRKSPFFKMGFYRGLLGVRA